ncbi:MAG: sensor histidine kinase [Pseudomonadota bacterium]
MDDASADLTKRRAVRRWRLFNLVYLLLFVASWVWQPPDRASLIAAGLALAVFLPVYFHAFERHEPAFMLHIGIIEAIALVLIPFAGMQGVFHVYACAQSAFQRPARRAIVLIVGLTMVYAAYALLVIGTGWLAIGFDLAFGVVIGSACIGAADGFERERQLERSRVLERQRATLAERERIAHDLHDILGHTLTMVAVKSDLAAKLIDRDPGRARREIDDVAEAARNALKDIRAAVYDMTATTVDTEIALARRALDAAGVSLDVRNALPPISPPVGKALGLTIREAVTNIVRHAHANAARIQIDQQGDELRLVVADNGVGSRDGASEGAGLAGLRKRIQALGGEATVDSVDGMRISVSLPLEPPPLQEAQA